LAKIGAPGGRQAQANHYRPRADPWQGRVARSPAGAVGLMYLHCLLGRDPGRSKRDSPATTNLPTTIRLAEPPEPFDWLRSA
jgi:hypothetical protein